MRALSIRQPWAWLVVNGRKPIENRDWTTSYRGPLLIHASKTITRKYYDQVLASLREADLAAAAAAVPAFEQLELGGIVGQAELVNCWTEHPSPWFTGEIGWELANAKPLPFMAWKGALGFFHVPADQLLVAGHGD